VSADTTSSPTRDPRRWYLVGAIALVAVTIAAAVTITWIAVGTGDDALATTTAAEHLARILDAAPIEVSSADLPSCPAGPADEVLGDLVEALGGGELQRVLDEGEIAVRAVAVGDRTNRFVDCTAETDDGGPGAVGIIASPSPDAVRSELQDEDDPTGGYTDLGSADGGELVGRCERDDGDCSVLWYDDQLLVGIGGGGPAFADIGTDQLQAVLLAALPTLVDGLARS